MEAMSRNPEEIARMLRKAESIAICSHVNPDGDTLGAAAAMKITLENITTVRATRITHTVIRVIWVRSERI